MHNKLLIKSIPFVCIFIFIMQLAFLSFKNQIDTRSLSSSNYIKKYPNVHKDFELSYTSSFVNKVYSKKSTKVIFEKSNLNYLINREKFFLPSRIKKKNIPLYLIIKLNYLKIKLILKIYYQKINKILLILFYLL